MERQKKALHKRSWSDLNTEVLSLVAERLSIHECVQFAGVCKNWQRAARDVIQNRGRSNLPMQLTYGWFNRGSKIISIMELSDLSAKKTYSIGQILGQEDRKLFLGAEVCASKNGWLLFVKKQRKFRNQPTILFFYNPFRNKIIELPPSLHLNTKIEDHVVTFTAAPTSVDDCFVYVMSMRFEHVRHCILCRCDLKRKRWNILCKNHVFDERVLALSYMYGTLFCILVGSKSLAAINLVDNGVEMMDLSALLETTSCQFHKHMYGSEHEFHFVEGESDGILYLLVKEKFHNLYALQFDQFQRVWVRCERYEEVFGNRGVFSHRRKSIVTAPLVGEESGEFANKISTKYQVKSKCGKFENNRGPEWDFLCECAQKKGLTRATFIQPLNLIGC